MNADDETLKHLAKLASKATKGRWMAVGAWVENTDDNKPDIVCADHDARRGPNDSYEQLRADVEYIAAAQPKQVMALIAEIRRLQAAVKEIDE